jgi:hypothetical protein
VGRARLIAVPVAQDETSVFGYLLAVQLIAIIAIVGMCGWSAFSLPW